MLADWDGPPDDDLHKEFHQLRTELAAFDLTDLLCAAGGLQLMPENANRGLRLEALAHILSTLPYQEGKPKITSNRLASYLKTYPLGAGIIESAEDPMDTAFAEALTFHGGSFVVFPGGADEVVFVLRHLFSSIFLGPNFLSEEQRANLSHLTTATLVLSNEIAARLGITRGLEPSHADQTIVLPDGQLTCSPFPDPRVMRVFEPCRGKEILDGFTSQEAAFTRADHRASA